MYMTTQGPVRMVASLVGRLSSSAGRRICAFLATAVLLDSAGTVLAQDIGTTKPEPTFSAHMGHGRLVIDRLKGGEPIVMEPKTWFHWPGAPTFVIRGGRTPRGLWLVGPGHIVVRDGITKDSPVIGRVEPSWDDQAIRLTLYPAEGPPIQSDVFGRLGVGAGRSVLTRLAVDSLEIGGTYNAVLRAPDGAEVGWLSVSIGGRPGYVTSQGNLPASVDEVLAAATVQALGSEVDYIFDHVRGVSRPPQDRP
jgi:hypothetical protein